MKIQITKDSVCIDPQLKGFNAITYKMECVSIEGMIQSIIRNDSEFGFRQTSTSVNRIDNLSVLYSSRLCFSIVGNYHLGYRYYCGGNIVDINATDLADAYLAGFNMFLLSHLED